MPEFAYTARDMTGQKVSGTVSAGTQREALSTLSARDVLPLVVAADRPVTAGRTPRVRPQLIATTYNQLAALLRSGVPLLRALDVLRNQSSHAGLEQVLGDVHDRVEEGERLGDAMARHERAFGEMATNIVRAGEEGGFLEDSLDRVAAFTEQQDEMRSQVIGALAYPIFLAVVGTVIVNVLVIFFVPQFEDLFSDLRTRGELPWVTDWLLAISHFMQGWGLLILPVAAIAFIVIRARLATDEGKLLRDRIRLGLPWAGPIYLDMAVARFCRVLGTLLNGGVPILRSLRISSDATGNRVLAAAVNEAAENISAGEALATPLAQSGHFPPTVVEMIAVAEESNTLETVLSNIADTLERQSWRRLNLFVRLLEPVMLLILAGVVLVVVIALLLPVLKMSTTM